MRNADLRTPQIRSIAKYSRFNKQYSLSAHLFISADGLGEHLRFLGHEPRINILGIERDQTTGRSVEKGEESCSKGKAMGI